MIPQPIKDILRLLLATLLPIAYVALKIAFPDFPLSQDTFVALIIWVVGLVLGGWNMHYLAVKYFGVNRNVV